MQGPEIAPGPQPEYFAVPLNSKMFSDLITIVMRWQGQDHLLTSVPIGEVDDLLKTMREHDAVHLTNGTRCHWRDQYAYT